MLNSEGKMHPLMAGLHFLGSKYIVHHFTLMQSKSEKRVKREDLTWKGKFIYIHENLQTLHRNLSRNLIWEFTQQIMQI